MALAAYSVIGVLLVALLGLFALLSRSATFRRLFRHYRPLDMLGIGTIALVGLWGLAGYVLAIPGFPVSLVAAVLTASAIGLYLQRIIGDARDSVLFGAPVRHDYLIEIWTQGVEEPRMGNAFVYRVQIGSRRSEDEIQFEVHVKPAIGNEDVVYPPVHFKRTNTAFYVSKDYKTASLRHGQEAFVDLVSMQQTDSDGWQSQLLRVQDLGQGRGYWRGGLDLGTGHYELTLKVFFSDRRNDEKRYAVDVDLASGKLELKILWP